MAFYLTIASRLPRKEFPLIGNLGYKVRQWCVSFLFDKCGINCNIQPHVYFGSGRGIKIGNNSGMGENFRIQRCSLDMGDNVMIAHDVQIIGSGHKYERTDIPMMNQGVMPKSHLVIKNDVWIGARVTILGNTKLIGKGVIIGAGAVVTNPIPDYAIVAGNPAKIIRFRNSSKL